MRRSLAAVCAVAALTMGAPGPVSAADSGTNYMIGLAVHNDYEAGVEVTAFGLTATDCDRVLHGGRHVFGDVRVVVRDAESGVVLYRRSWERWRCGVRRDAHVETESSAGLRVRFSGVSDLGNGDGAQRVVLRLRLLPYR